VETDGVGSTETGRSIAVERDVGEDLRGAGREMICPEKIGASFAVSVSRS
jgi:hypothetical protein